MLFDSHGHLGFYFLKTFDCGSHCCSRALNLRNDDVLFIIGGLQLFKDRLLTIQNQTEVLHSFEYTSDPDSVLYICSFSLSAKYRGTIQLSIEAPCCRISDRMYYELRTSITESSFNTHSYYSRRMLQSIPTFGLRAKCPLFPLRFPFIQLILSLFSSAAVIQSPIEMYDNGPLGPSRQYFQTQ